MPSKENEQLVLKRSELPTGFLEMDFKKSQFWWCGCRVPEYLSDLLNWSCLAGVIFWGVNIINLVSQLWFEVHAGCCGFICGNLVSIKQLRRDFPGGPMLKTLASQSMESGFEPCSGN